MRTGLCDAHYLMFGFNVLFCAYTSLPVAHLPSGVLETSIA